MTVKELYDWAIKNKCEDFILTHEILDEDSIDFDHYILRNPEYDIDEKIIYFQSI